MTLLWLVLFACAAGPPPVEPSPVPTVTPPAPEASVSSVPVLKERLRVMLKTGEARSLSPLDVEVVLVNGEVDLIRRPDGRLFERSHGRLRFVRGDESTELDFDEGTAFETWGYRMAVFGGGGDFELSVFPEGEPVRP